MKGPCGMLVRVCRGPGTLGDIGAVGKARPPAGICALSRRSTSSLALTTQALSRAERGRGNERVRGEREHRGCAEPACRGRISRARAPLECGAARRGETPDDNERQ